MGVLLEWGTVFTAVIHITGITGSTPCVRHLQEGRNSRVMVFTELAIDLPGSEAQWHHQGRWAIVISDLCYDDRVTLDESSYWP